HSDRRARCQAGGRPHDRADTAAVTLARGRALDGTRARGAQPRGLRRARAERCGAGRAATRRDHMSLLAALGSVVIGLLTLVGAAAAADYTGPLIDAHAHVSSATAIDTYVAAMKRHNIRKVVLLGVGGLQREEAEWIEAAARKYPDLVAAGVRIPDPTNMAAAGQLDVELARTKARVMGEAHIRHVARKIERDPSAPAFMQILELSAQRGVPVVIHDELGPADFRARDARPTHDVDPSRARRAAARRRRARGLEERRDPLPAGLT